MHMLSNPLPSNCRDTRSYPNARTHQGVTVSRQRSQYTSSYIQVPGGEAFWHLCGTLFAPRGSLVVPFWIPFRSRLAFWQHSAWILSVFVVVWPFVLIFGRIWRYHRFLRDFDAFHGSLFGGIYLYFQCVLSGPFMLLGL